MLAIPLFDLDALGEKGEDALILQIGLGQGRLKGLPMRGVDLDLRREVPEALSFELPDFADAVQLGLVRGGCLFGGSVGVCAGVVERRGAAGSTAGDVRRRADVRGVVGSNT